MSVDPRRQEVVVLVLAVDHLAFNGIGVVAPGSEVALHTQNGAERRVAELRLTTTAFNVAPLQHEVGAVTWVDQVQRGTPTGRQQGVVKPGRVHTAEGAARGDLRHGQVVVHAKFHVHLGSRRDLVVGVGIEAVTL